MSDIFYWKIERGIKSSETVLQRREQDEWQQEWIKKRQLNY